MEWFLDGGAFEVEREEIAYRPVPDVDWLGLVLVVHPEWCFGVVTE